MKYWVRTERCVTNLFGDETATHVDWHALEASGPDAAADEIIRRRHSVGDLREGVTCEVYEARDFVGVWHGQYDKEPMNDHSATDAQLVIARRLDLEPAVKAHLEEAQRGIA